MCIRDRLYEKFEGPKFSALNLILGTIIIAVPLFFIVRQPDLGTSILIASAGFFVLYLGGISKKSFYFYCLFLLFLVQLFGHLCMITKKKEF